MDDLKRTEVPQGMAMAQWAIAWCLQPPAVTCVVAGARSVQQLQSNAAAADLELIREDHPQVVVPYRDQAHSPSCRATAPISRGWRRRPGRARR